jgi:dihydropteroate synthase
MVKILECGRWRLKLDKTLVMGVLNVTPDSFYDGGRYSVLESALAHARTIVSEGADILDVGGESTRPGSKPLSVREEKERVIPLIEELAGEVKIPISIDSYKPEVVEEAFKAGASMLNDVYGLRSPGMAELAASFRLPVVVMHMQGTPKTMQENPRYRDVVSEVKTFFSERVDYALSKGVKRKQIIFDPGIGFGKTLEHNLELLRRLPEFKELGFPILIGASRKSMIGGILGLPPEERLEGSLAVAVASIMAGADILRVHDVKETVRAARVADAIVRDLRGGKEG